MNEPDFEYDIHSLVGAFYPGEKIKISTYAKDAENAEDDVDIKLKLYVEYKDRQVGLCLKSPKDGLVFATNYQKTVDVPYLGKEYGTSRKQTKNILKRALYDILSEHMGKTLPWGTLTGIRPVKLMMGELNGGRDEDEAKALIMREYLVSEKKACLMGKIAKKEMRITEMPHIREGYSLYINIPFCPSRCLYCSFTSYPIEKQGERVKLYLDSLFKEMEAVSRMTEGRRLWSIYVGGGTPTSLSAPDLRRLFDEINLRFNTQDLLEYTVEAGRADSIDEEKLKLMKEYGVSRISINPQTMNQKTLDIIGRAHSAEDVRDCFYKARTAGFDNINMDIILGLPGENEDDVANTLREIEKLNPDSLTVHSLALKRSSRLKEEYGEYASKGMVNNEKMVDMCALSARDMGLEPYYLYRQKQIAGNLENTGYAAPGREGIYNVLIMEEVHDIVAVGAGGASKNPVSGEGKKRVERCENVKDIVSYVDRIDEMIKRKQELFGCF